MKKLFIIAVVLVFSFAQAKALDYKVVPDWLKLPEGRTQLGNMHGDVAVTSKGEVYVSVQDPQAGLQVFSPDGKFLRNVPGAPNDFHGFVIRKQQDGEFIYGSRLQGQTIIKMTLDGKVVLEIPASAIPDEFKQKNKKGNAAVRLTGMDIAPNGDLYVTDGYATDYIHHFDRNGKYLASFGGKAEPYNFKTLHKLIIDTRFDPPRILACDRANFRLVHLSLDGKFLGEYAKDLMNPAALAIHGDYVATGEIKGRVTVLDKAGKIVEQFGLSDVPEERGTNKTEPAKWRPGIVTAPHGIAFNDHGDIYVAEYNVYGRVHRFDLVSEKNSELGWRSLFNGKDLNGWYVHVRDREKNSDPTGIVGVTDGMIHMYSKAEQGSKQPIAVVCTDKEFDDYDLRFEYKWGEKKFAPRVDKVRDAGLLYHCYDERVWPSSIECQVQEGDVGDLFIVRSQAKSTVDTNETTKRVFLPESAGGVMRTFGNPEGVVGVRKSFTNEKEGWNTVEVKVRGASSVHIVNGKTNHMVFDMARMVDGKWQPLTKGRIALQAEYSEVFYRNVEIRPVGTESAAK